MKNNYVSKCKLIVITNIFGFTYYFGIFVTLVPESTIPPDSTNTTSQVATTTNNTTTSNATKGKRWKFMSNICSIVDGRFVEITRLGQFFS